MENIDLLDMDFLEDAAELLKVMSHPVRLQIVHILTQGDFSVGEIAEMCELPPNQTCEHLRRLKTQGLLKSRRQGRMVYYSINSPRLPRLIQCILEGCENT